MLRLAVLGLGNRAADVLGAMRDMDSRVRVAGVADPDREIVERRLKDLGYDVEVVRYYATAAALLEDADAFDGVLIGSRCYLHTELACMVALTGLPLYLEKPVAISSSQMEQLAAAFKGHEQNVQISFPLRSTPLFAAAHEIVSQGRLGTINQIQAINNVPYGGVYFGHWYRNYDEVGGLWLQKATHDFDYLNQLLGVPPLKIAATATQKIYGGNKPHDLLCSACDEIDTCSESARLQEMRGDSGGMEGSRNNRGDLDDDDHWCPFSRDIKNQDAGSAIIMYACGAHVAYTQNFVSRRSAGRRGAIVTGHLASLEFDWFTEKLRVIDHHRERVDEIEVKAATSHGGGDHVLAKTFIGMMRGESGPFADLRDGLLSVAMCLAARESAYAQTFRPVVPPWKEKVPRPATSTEIPVGRGS